MKNVDCLASGIVFVIYSIILNKPGKGKYHVR